VHGSDTSIVSSDSATSDNGRSTLEDIIYQLCVNLLLYAVLIIVFYMLTRFYLEEETSSEARREEYTRVHTQDPDMDETDKDKQQEQADIDVSASEAPPVAVGAIGSFLNILEFAEPEGTKQEVIQRVFFCAFGLHTSFCIWALLQVSSPPALSPCD
jgi:hypothetical protein